MTIFNTKNVDHLKAKMFLDEGGSVAIARYDKVKYPFIDKITQDMVSLFWIPEETDLSQDKRDFNNLSESDKHIFLSNLKRQTVLDTVQARAPSVVFLPIVTIPELEPAIDTIVFFESIHSRSYTHIIRNVLNDPSLVFDNILDIPEIQDMVSDVSKYYDALHIMNCKKELQTEDYNLHDHKKAIYLALVAWNALEAVRFYVSFICSWAFAERGTMEGNAKIIKWVARDENFHKFFTTKIINTLAKDDPEFVSVISECEGEATQIYLDVSNQEKAWSKYLFKEGVMIGLSEKILCDFVDWRTMKCMKSIGLTPIETSIKSNPVTWMSAWLDSSGDQVAPQETEITSYLQGVLKPDVDGANISHIFDLKRALKLT